MDDLMKLILEDQNSNWAVVWLSYRKAKLKHNHSSALSDKISN